MLNENAAAAIFLALSHPKRMEIIKLLAEHPEGLCGIEISQLLEARQNTVTVQLLLLEEVGLVISKRCGYRTVRTINATTTKDLFNYVREGFRSPQPPPEAPSMRKAG